MLEHTLARSGTRMTIFMVLALALVACGRTSITVVDRKDTGIATRDTQDDDSRIAEVARDTFVETRASDLTPTNAPDGGDAKPEVASADVPVEQPDSGRDVVTGSVGGRSGTGGSGDVGGLSSGGRSGSSSSGGAGGRTGGVGGYSWSFGGSGVDWSSGTGGSTNPCTSISQIPDAVQPLCTFDGTLGGGCLASTIKVLEDSTYRYFALDHGLGILQCPVGVTNPNVFVDGKPNAPGHTLRGQTLSNGTIRFVCEMNPYQGNSWDFRFTCAASRVQTVQPYLKSGDLYVLIPAENHDGGSSGYEGHIYGYRFPDSTVLYRASGTGKEGSLGEYPVTYSFDGKTLSFADPSGAQIAIRLDARLEVVDIQRRP